MSTEHYAYRTKRKGARAGLTAGRIAALVLCLSWLGFCAAQSPSVDPAANEKSTFQYRRWFAPMDRIEDWPFEEGRYIPLKRELFEEWTELLKKTSGPGRSPSGESLSRIVLYAKLEGRQLSGGRGFLDVRNDSATDADGPDSRETSRSIPLDPWGLWIDSATTDRGDPVSIVGAAGGEMRLLLPDRGKMPDRVHFHWSLRSRADSSGQLQFDFLLPASAGVELSLDLPAFMTPSIPSGIVLKEDGPASVSRSEKSVQRWRILFGRPSMTTLTISAETGPEAPRQKTSIRQNLVYRVTPQGVEATARIFFDKADPYVRELLVDLESPLRPIQVQYADRNVPWSYFKSDVRPDETHIQINLADVGKGESRELTLVLAAPLQDGRDWTLPRVRVVSPNVFWQETRCAVSVQSPLSVQRVSCEKAVQVPPLSTYDRVERDVFVFQFFEEDARVSVHLDFAAPRMQLNSFTQVQWGASEIKGNVVVDCKMEEGDLYSLELPVSPYWTINSVKSVFGDDILAWNLVEGRSASAANDDLPESSAPAVNSWLSIQLKRLLRPKESLRFQILGRFQPPEQQEFRLDDVSPLALVRKKEESHFIAIQSDSPYHVQYRSPVPPASEIRDPLDSRLSSRTIDPPMGTVLVLDSRTKEIRFGIERLKPNYSAEIFGTIQLKEKELVSSYRILCQPIDSSVDRLYVHFMPGDPSGNESARSWSGSFESSSPLQARLLREDELEEMYPSLGQANLPDMHRGETWEIRWTMPQLNPFEIRTSQGRPFSDLMPVPLVSLPFAVSQKGEIRIEASRIPHYQVFNSRLTSIPVAAPEWYRYQETRAAFRYDPSEELKQAMTAPVVLKKTAADETLPAALVWSLRLDTQYEPEGIVKNNAVFFLENNGKESLRIHLPENVHTQDVHAVWLDDIRVTWHPESAPECDTQEHVRSRCGVKSVAKGATNGSGEPRTNSGSALKPHAVVVSLPEGKRFVSVALEYSSRDVPLTHRRTLKPSYPTADVPILTGNWTSWFPPEFEVATRHWSSPGHDSRPLRSISRAVDVLQDHSAVEPFSRSFWTRLFRGEQRRQDAIRASRIFLEWLATGLNEAVDRPVRSASSSPSFSFNDSDGKNARTWADLFRDEALLRELLNRSEPTGDSASFREHRRTREGDESRVRVLVDYQALARLGITPSTPVSYPESYQTRDIATEILSQNGLILLLSPGTGESGESQYTFYITSFLKAALHHHFQSEPIGNNIRFLPNPFPVSHADLSSSKSSPAETDSEPPRWLPLGQWCKNTQISPFPWPVAPQIVRLASITPDWIAYEIPQSADNSLYIVHRNTYAAYHWLAFLAVVALTWKRPFSSPIFLVGLLVLFEILTRWTIPCHALVPSGAFFGAAVSLGFSLVRSRFAGAIPVKFQRYSSLRTEISPTTDGTTAPIDDFEVSPSPTPQNNQASAPSIETEAFFSRFPGNIPEDPMDVPDRPEPSDQGSGGSTARTFLLAGLLGASGWLSAGVVSAQPLTPPPPVKASPISVELQQEPRVVFIEETIATEPSVRPPTCKRTSSRKEPYRVFFPVDESRKVTGNITWLPEEFFLSLYRDARNLSTGMQDRWSIRKAEYQGTLSSGTLVSQLTVSQFKAVFEIVLDEENVTIILPSLPVVPDGALWNSVPIQPTWQVRESRSAAPDGEVGSRDENRVLVFNIANEKKGRHVLELTLDPKIVRSDDLCRVSLDIPKVPNSVLRLNTSPDAPVVNVPDCLGAVTPNSPLSPTLTAEIGPLNKLMFSWIDEPTWNDPASIEAESLFWLRARPSQVDLRAKIRYRIEGGKVRYVNLTADPRWQLSGQFHCEEQPIERVETHYAPVGPDDPFLSQGEITRLVFKTPVSGTLTIRAGFVLKDFSGIGKIRLPRIKPLQSRVGKSILAISAEPLLELDLPSAGQGTGFETGWFGGVSSMAAISETKAFGNGSGSGPVDSSGVSSSPTTTEERPLAEYDLSRTPSSWTLGIRTKTIPPGLNVTQSFRFDDGDSKTSVTGDFTTSNEMFQQSFFCPDLFRIESIEVRDAQDNAVELRWEETGRTRELDGEIQRERMIFFRRPLSGRYQINVSGHFSSKTTADRSFASKDKVRIPLLMFDDVTVGEQRLEFFRTSSVLADLFMEESGWSPSEVEPIPPKSYANSLIVGSWKRGGEQVDGLPWHFGTFTLLPNRPVIRGETISSLSRGMAPDSWDVTFDILWTISQGELETLRFRWDERCGSIHSIDPPIPWTLEQRNGHSQLLLSPKVPFSGQRHLRIKAAVNTSGHSVALPVLTPILEKTERFESETYVILPKETDGVSVPWNLVQLAAVDDRTAARLRSLTAVRLPTERQPSGPFPRSDSTEEMVSMDSLPSQFYFRATGDDFAASVAPKNTRPVISLFDVNLFARKNGDLFGIAGFDLKASGHESIVLTMPPGFELVQLASPGIACEGLRLSERHWRIDLCSSDYPQRISIIFRGTLRSLPENEFGENVAAGPFSLSNLAEKRVTTSIPIPLLENVDIRETLWTLSFETNPTSPLPVLAVSSVREEERDHTSLLPQRHDIVEPLGRHVPIVGEEAAQTLLKFDLVRLDNLLFTLSSVPSPTPLKMAEVKQWCSQWMNEWLGTVQLINDQTQRYPTILRSSDYSVLQDPRDRRPDASGIRTIGAFIDSMKVPELTLQALLVRQKQAMEKLDSANTLETRKRLPAFSTNATAQCRGRMTEDASHLFGALEGSLKELRITSIPDSFRWSERLFSSSTLWLAILAAFLFGAGQISFLELLQRFPRFWGTCLGLLLICLFPPGIWGGIVLLLVVLSALRPAWVQLRVAGEKNRG